MAVLERGGGGGGELVSGIRRGEGDNRLAEVDLAGNLGNGAGGIRRRDNDAE